MRSRLRTIEIIENSIFPCFSHEHLDLSYALDILNPNPFELFDTISDLTRSDSYKRMIQLRSRVENPELQLQSLCDRVSALESSYDRLVKEKLLKRLDRKYTWTAESKDRKYTWTAEIKGDHKKKVKELKEKDLKEVKEKKGAVKSYKWTAEIKGHPIARSYTFEASSGDARKSCGAEKEKKKGKKKNDTRIVEIEDVADHGAFVLKRAFTKRDNGKGKKKELSPLDAACMIQMNFRAYLIRRSQTLRGLRELAVAKTKLKELRGLFHNFAYRRHVSRDAEECQRFSEKIIVLLLTVDAIEGADVMVRSAKRSMVEELETMLDVIDPQPISKSLSMRRRTFDMPSGGIQKEIAAGVAQVAQMINEENDSSSFEACV